MPLTHTDNSAMTGEEVLSVQRQLKELGFDPGPLDGIMGPHTESAIISFKRSKGLRLRPYVGPLTWGMLHEPTLPGLSNRGGPLIQTDLPWVLNMWSKRGLHEVGDKKELMSWLASDGYALGDITKFPWCGDGVETSIRLTLPNEPVPQNPYWALNWQNWGVPSSPTFGCVISIRRNGGGHVGFLVGEDSSRYYVLGANQKNMVCVVPISKNRFTSRSFRWPSTYPERAVYLPRMSSAEKANIQEG